MLTRSLIYVLQKAKTPRMIRAAVTALERVTGLSTKAIVASFNLAQGDWYARNGYPALSNVGGMGSFSGKSVSAETAFEVSAYYAIVKILSEDTASMPCFVYQKSGKNTREATEHPLFSLLHDMPNEDTEAGGFFEAMTAHAIVYGDAFARIDRFSNGEVNRLRQLQPADARIDVRGPRPVYYFRDQSGKEEAFSVDQVFHLRGFTLNGLTGDSVITRCKHILGLNIAQQEYAGRFFANDASPGIIVTRPVGAPALTPEGVTTMKEAWMRWHQGAGRAHEPAILQEGATVQRIDPDHQKLQLIEQRKFQLEEIARPHRVPLHRLMHLDRMTFNNVEQLGIDYLTSALEPWRRRWRQSIYRCLLTPEERAAGYYAELKSEIFLRGDFKTQWEGFARGLEKGVYSINEVRRILNLNPVEGGDRHYVQLNMQDITAAAESSVEESA